MVRFGRSARAVPRHYDLPALFGRLRRESAVARLARRGYCAFLFSPCAMYQDKNNTPDAAAPHWCRVLDRLEALNEKIDQLCAERDPDRLLTREEAAERLQVSVRTLDTLRAAGEIRAVKVKRRVRFHPDAVDAYIRRNAEEGCA